ncbi:flotillin family protein, partial [Paenibacillus sp. NPDC058910]
MSTAPEMLKSVSGIDVEELIKGLTKKSAPAQNPVAVEQELVPVPVPVETSAAKEE